MLDLINKPGIKDAYSIRNIISESDYKDAFFEESSNFSLTRCLVINIILQEQYNVSVFTWAASTTLYYK